MASRLNPKGAFEAKGISNWFKYYIGPQKKPE